MSSVYSVKVVVIVCNVKVDVFYVGYFDVQFVMSVNGGLYLCVFDDCCVVVRNRFFQIDVVI